MTQQTSDFLDPRIEGRHIIRTDPHCHILPGLDDGARSMDISLRMARRMVSVGILNAVATPHGIHPGIETNVDPNFLRDQVHLLNQALQRAGIPLTIYPGTEVFLRGRVRQALDEGKLITWADQGKFILTELGFQRHSAKTLAVIDHFIEAGLTPIIAHPERYGWLPTEAPLFEELRERGCVFQYNTMSINGHFGDRIQSLVTRLIPASGNFIIGTDSHNDSDRYFDMENIRRTLTELGLRNEDGTFSATANVPLPPLSDLAASV